MVDPAGKPGSATAELNSVNAAASACTASDCPGACAAQSSPAPSASLGTIAIEPLRKAALDRDRDTKVRSEAFNSLGRITGNEAFNTQLAIINEWQKHSADQESFAPTLREFIYEPSHLGRPKVLRDAARKQKGAAKVATYRIALQLEQSPLANDSFAG